ncbi:MAG: hypothetical protein ABFD96_05090, partial [Armatimonadia bacterium]
EMATVVRDAALNGDAKMALEVLKHQHNWVAKTSVEVSVEQRISITAALEAAQGRLIEGTAQELPAMPLRQLAEAG